ncbi:MAG: NADH:flavin oxidoreductase [Lachnospiraceae bacterium]|nr:NADH:flavin oxidoreductase [Lachnospiraceae bacterium]
MDLFESTMIGGVSARNHFIRSATAEGKATEDGFPTETIRQVYLNLARNEVGVIITSLASVADYEKSSGYQLMMDRDGLIPAYQEITETVHAEGGSIVMQLVHGSSSAQAFPEQAKILGPSSIRNPISGLVPRQMDVDDMAEVAGLFARAAVRAKRAGFDGVQIHGAHSCLLSQFLSPVFNQRTDAFGGSRENRFRFVREVYDAVRGAVGPAYPVWMKLDCTDGFENGLSTEDFLWNGEQLAMRGLDAIEVSGMRQPRVYKGAYYREAAERLAERINAPVILTGGVRSVEDMQVICAESRVQFFGMSRPFLAHPDYITRLKDKR